MRSDRETLYDIGNVAGRPTTHYASFETQAEQMRATLDEITKIVQGQLGIPDPPPPDPEKFRTNPGLTMWRRKSTLVL